MDKALERRLVQAAEKFVKIQEAELERHRKQDEAFNKLVKEMTGMLDTMMHPKIPTNAQIFRPRHVRLPRLPGSGPRR